MRSQLIFYLNGQERRLDGISPDLTLLEWLRADGLTATKEGCAEGDCGACSIALGTPNAKGSLEWQAVNACLFLIGQVDGRHILTAEGISALQESGAPHPIQIALAEGHGTQCGYCTPGFVTTLWTHWRTGQVMSRPALLDSLAGNLCRCTGYRPILDSMSELPAVSEQARNADHAIAEQLSALRQDEITFSDGHATYAAPASLPRLIEIWSAKAGPAPWSKTSDTWLTAGATDLGLNITKHGQKPKLILSLERVAELHSITETQDVLRIGASAPYAKALPHLDRLFPDFASLVRRIGAGQVRNMGSFGGNLGTASPIGDSLPPLLVLEAMIEITGPKGPRHIPATEFITGYRQTILQPGELISAILVPKLAGGSVMRCYKLAKRVDQDISTVSACFLLADGKLRAAFGGVAATPIRAVHFEAALGQREENKIPFAIEAALAALQNDISPMSDARGSAEYRRLAAANLAKRFFAEISSDTTNETRLEALA